MVIGAGPVGCLAASTLAARGFAVDVYERRPDFARHGFGDEGRTINLSLSPRGLRALDIAGCEQEFLEVALPMDRRVVHTGDGQVLTTRYDRPQWRNHSISRNDLNLVLLRNVLRWPAVRTHFETGFRSIDFDRRQAVFTTSTGARVSRSYDLLVGADGARSKVRGEMSAQGILACERTTLDSEYREVTIRPVDPDQLSRGAIHLWPREGFFLCALPNVDGTFRATLVLPAEGPLSFREVDRTGVRHLVERHFGDVLPLIDWHSGPTARNPASRIEQVLCDTLHHRGSVLLAGDAAHTMAPFLGQGINAGFEDVLTLDEVLRTHRGALDVALSRYGRERELQGHAATRLSMINYTELTTRTGTGRPVTTVSDPPLPIATNFLGLSYQEVLHRHRAAEEKSEATL
jgi:kynurenine 3-monooxygenase